MERLSKEKLYEIGEGIYKNQIFTSRSVCPMDMIPQVFAGLNFVDNPTMEEIKKDIGERGILYADMKDALPIGVNGYPIFFTFGVLSGDETDFVLAHARKLHRAEERARLPWWKRVTKFISELNPTWKDQYERAQKDAEKKSNV